MVVFPNSKINLGLRIVNKRNDGYHDLDTVFYPLPFYDALEVIRNVGVNGAGIKDFDFTITGLPIEETTDNLCQRAFQLLKNDFPDLPPVNMHLHKAIPVGAGLGGGSADASFTLTLLNSKFQLGLTTEQLLQYALKLGSDCPFFIINKPCHATGRGEFLQPVDLGLSSYKFVLINPGIHISTGEAFSGTVPAIPVRSTLEIISQPVHTWKDELMNDFEKTIFPAYPEIEKIKTSLYEQGALYASMSGTGSSVYGIFEKNRRLNLKVQSHYFYKEI
ncbi:MAG TPA: 4-(cytidine 5'-diphospho)-2-C-methyl-D-erythritol kinase [Chitinophagaceae bacterium]|nr:4-(cytidine 5'-diphospho)-2-C-methyl-D-erythritol kinase [Chitinophagaceae bacterium]